MFFNIMRFCSIFATACMAIYPHISAAETFQSSDVLAWPEEKQRGYFTTSVTMVGVIASQIDRNQSRCIDAWYVIEEGKDHVNLLNAMHKHASIHPQGIILWVIQNQCGKIGRKVP